MNRTFAIKGDICFSKALTELEFHEDSYLVCENGKAAGIYRELPEKYKGMEVFDYTGKLVCHGM